MKRTRAIASLVLAVALLPNLIGVAHALGPGVIGSFEIDGDFVHTGSQFDWDNVGNAIVVDDPISSTSDNSFGGGQKEDAPDDWTFIPHKPPPKDDLSRGYLASRITATNAYLYMGFERIVNNGNAHVDFELNKSGLTIVNSAGQAVPVHTAGDLLINFDGNTLAAVGVQMWQPAGGVNPGGLIGSWVPALPLPNATAGTMNTADVPRPAGVPFGGGTAPSFQFGELGVDLAAVLGEGFLARQCETFGTFSVKSRSSGGSDDNQLKDLIGPVPINISTCGGLTVTKQDDSGNPLAGATFQAWKDLAPLNGQFDPTDTLVGTCITGANGLCTIPNVLPGTNYYVREILAPLGYVLDPFIAGPITIGLGENVQVSQYHVFVDPKIRFRLSITPVEDTNLVNNDHVFTVLLEKSLNAGSTWIPAGTESVALGLTGQGTFVPSGLTTGSCTTSVIGVCLVTIHSTTAGDSTLSATFDKLTSTTPVHVTSSALKHWVNYRINIGPQATNAVGTNHTFTVTLEKTTNGSVWSAVSGATVGIVKTGVGSYVGGGGTCLTGQTSVAGTCTVVITSATPGSTTIQASYAAVESGTFATFSQSAVKQWVDYRVVVSPDETNLVGQAHTFTVTVQQNTGSGWVAVQGAHVDLGWTGPVGSLITGGTCTGVGTTNSSGQCTAIVNSPATGAGTLTATYGTVLDSGPLTRSDQGVKTWIAYTISVTPQTDTNLLPVEPTHTFTVTLGSSDTNIAPIVGQTVALTLGSTVATLTNVGVGGTIAPDGLSGTCVTDVSGTCTVIITTTSPGLATLTAEYSTTVNSATLDISDDGAKSWITYRLNVTPASATNLAGSDHTFTVTVETTGDGVNWTPVADVKPTIQLLGVGSITTNNCAATGTDVNGQCTVVIHSDSTGVATLTASYLATVGQASYAFADTGTKTWIDFLVTVTPQEAANLTGSNHVFTVTVFKDSGNGSGFLPLAGAVPTIQMNGVGSIVTNTCLSGTLANGTCTVTISSDDPGLTTVTATYSGTADNGSADFVSPPAVKQWVNYRLSVSPEEATNAINDPHTFTVTLEKDLGSGFIPAGEEEVDLDITGVGTITSIPGGVIDPGLVSGGCVTSAAGTCTITIVSSEPGDTTVIGTFNAVIGDSEGTFSDSGVKHWFVAPAIQIVKTADPISGTPGVSVTYTYVVTNIGDTPLYDMVVTDDKLGAIGTIDGPLNPGDSVTLTKTTTVTSAGELVNVGTVVGNDRFGHTVTDDDDAVVTIVLGRRSTPKTGLNLQIPTGVGFTFFFLGTAMVWTPRRRRLA